MAKSSDDNNDQWLGSRGISAQKANTANAFGLNAGEGSLGAIAGLALSTANLYSAVQPGGSLAYSTATRWMPERRTKATLADMATSTIQWLDPRSAASTSLMEGSLSTTQMEFWWEP